MQLLPNFKAIVRRNESIRMYWYRTKLHLTWARRELTVREAIMSNDRSREFNTACDSLHARMLPVVEAYEAALRRGETPEADGFLSGWEAAERDLLCEELQNVKQQFQATAIPPHATNQTVLPLADRSTAVAQESQLPTPTDRGRGAMGDDEDEGWRTLEIPGHEILGVLGQGGMGQVLRVRDSSLDRSLAVKVMLPRYGGQAELSQRFLAEARVTGQLQHPGIPPVHAVGRLPDGRPFFSMKLIEGETLAKLLRDRAGAQAELPRFLKIFEQVCQTIAYAHSRGVIHRDLKPVNVMVGAFGEVQVMDWGLAGRLKEPRGAQAGPQEADALDATGAATSSAVDTPAEPDRLTQTGQVLGTLPYMPPEQARGEMSALDERCDVFGLGAILCEMLTGRPPYAASDFDELRRRAVGGDLDDAFARIEACGADAELIAIAKRALAANRADRPRNAGALAAQVRKYLESVDARRRQAEMERARSEVQVREARRRMKVVLAASVLALALVTGGAAVWYVRQTELSQRRVQTQESVNLALGKAEQLRAQAAGMPLVTSRQAQDAIAVWKQAQGAVDEAEGALAVGLVDDALRDRVLRLGQQIDSASNEAGRNQVQLLREERLFRDLDAARMAMLTLKKNRLDYAGAAQRYAEAFSAFGISVLPGRGKDIATRIEAQKPAVSQALIVGIDNWASCSFLGGAPAPPLLDELLEISKACDGDAWRNECREASQEGNGPKLRRLAGEARERQPPAAFLWLLASRLSEFDRAAAIDVLKWARTEYPADPWVHFQLGGYLSLGTNLSTVEMEEVVGCYRTAAALQPGAAAPLINLGNSLLHKKDLLEAIRVYRSAIAIDRAAYDAHLHLGVALADLRRFDEAIQEYETATNLDPANPDGYYNLGNAFYDQGRLDDAIGRYRKAVQLDDGSRDYHWNLARALYDKKKFDEAIEQFRMAIQRDPSSGGLHNSLGAALVQTGRLDEAIAEFLEAIKLNSGDYTAHTNLGDALAAKGQLAQATTAYQQAIEINAEYANAHFNLGRVLHLQGRFVEAKGSFGRARDLLPITDPYRPHCIASLQTCEGAISLESKMRDVLDAKRQPADNQERLGFVEVCRYQRRFATAARFYAEAFAADEKLAEDLAASHRYSAACFAALAATGQGVDAGNLADDKRAPRRQQALDWLRADLAQLAKTLEGGKPDDQKFVVATLQHWQTDPDLASIREREPIEKLPPEERAAWEKLWRDAKALRERGEAVQQKK